MFIFFVPTCNNDDDGDQSAADRLDMEADLKTESNVAELESLMCVCSSKAWFVLLPWDTELHQTLHSLLSEFGHD